MEKLFLKYKTANSIAKAPLKDLEKILFGIGFYKTKSKNLKSISIETKGNVPNTLDALLKLPGVGRKTANIVLARAFKKDTLGVDVHVHRISNRIGIVNTKKPEETEKKLLELIPNKYIRNINRYMVAFGQTFCTPRKPKCKECRILKFCKFGKQQTI